MIPHKIHYCWFSKESFPALVNTCIQSWKRFMPEYEFILWDYDKARQIQMPWINKALEENRWAFAADAVRLYAVYSEGGIYLDSDVEALRSFDPLTNRPYFFGYENGSHRIEAATFGAEAHFPAVEKALQFYQTHFFEYKESDVDFLVIPNILAETFQNMQLEIFSEDYFSPKNFTNGQICISPNTFSIHHFSSSWRPSVLQKSIRCRQWIYKHFPQKIAKILHAPLSILTNFYNLGWRKTLKKIVRRFNVSKDSAE